MSKHHCANASRAARVLCGAFMALVLASLSQSALSQNSGAASPSLQGLSQLAGTVGSKRASLIAKIAPGLKPGLTAQEAAEILGTPAELSEGSRRSAITSMARAKKHDPLGAEAALMLKGTTGSNRSFSIGELAPYLKANLTAQEVADILGSVAELSEGSRRSAITSMARAKKLGPLGAEAALMLKGTTGSNRSFSIGELAPYLKANLTAREAADILGTPAELSEGSRRSAITSMARAKKLGPLGAEAALMLKGTTGSNRSFSIGELAPYLKANLTAREAADILGTPAELSEGSRRSAITSMARAGKVRAGLSEAELAPVLDGTTGSARAFALAELRAAQTMSASAAGMPASAEPLSPLPGPTAQSTPAVASTGCTGGTDVEQRFCELLEQVGAQLIKVGADRVEELVFREALQASFNRLPKKVQTSLFQRGFLAKEFATRPYAKAFEATTKGGLIEVRKGLVGIVAAFFKDAFDEWAVAKYSSSPWTYMFVQGAGDQLYVGLLALQTYTAAGPQAMWWSIFVEESLITGDRLVRLPFAVYGLSQDRAAAVASLGQQLMSGSSAALAKQRGLLPSTSRLTTVSREATIAGVRQSVAGTDIPKFDLVAQLIFDAQSNRIFAMSQSTVPR